MTKSFCIVSIAALAAGAVPSAAAAQSARVAADQRQSRYQIGQMERVLEGAVEHGATVIRDRLQALAPTETIMLDNARVRGFRLDGYGVFFDVFVPSFESTLLWSLRTLDQNNLGLDSALTKVKTYISQTSDTDLQQAFRRIELQMAPLAALASAASPIPGSRTAAGSAASVGAAADARPVTTPSGDVDPILTDPDEAYRTEVMHALEDAMLDHSAPLHVGADEWLTIAARRNEERTRLAPADSDARTIVIRARGTDLNAFLAGQITREEALKRIERRVF